MKKKKNIDYEWIFKIFVITFVLSITFNMASTAMLSDASIIGSAIIILLVISLGIVFDIVGVAVATADESIFHSMSAKKVKAARVAVIFKKNADRVASFCNDIIGDICGIVSGSAGVALSSSIASFTGYDLLVISLIVTGVIASLTIGGKAMGKSVAMSKSSEILYTFAKVVSLVYKPKK